jgi:thioredoxin-related protein
MKKTLFIRAKSLSATLLLLLFCIICSDHAAAAGIHFETGPFSELLKKAEKENKMIFLDCCTSWCPPCRRMEKNVFPNDMVGDFYNSHFVCEIFDMEKEEGKELAKRYEISCYPTYLFLDKNGNLLHRQSGEWPVAQFIDIGNTALSPELQFATFEKRYAAGKLTPDEMLRYIEIRKATYLPVDSILDAYMKIQPDTSFLNRKNWTLLNKYKPAPWNHMFQYVLNHQEEFSEKYTADSVKFLVKNVYGSQMGLCFPYSEQPDTIMYKKLRAEVVGLHLPYEESIVSFYDMDFYSIAGNQLAFAKAACTCVHINTDSTTLLLLNFIIQKFYQNVTDTAYLDTAISWAALSARLEPNLFSTSNYAHLLYQRGRKQEAEVQAIRAIDFADKMGRDATEEKELLKKIQAMK